MAISEWMCVKEAAAMVGITPRQFRDEWVPEDGPAQVNFRNPNGKSGRFRRVEVSRPDLERVLEERTFKRAG